MNTNQLITALLHGELTNDQSVAELMHILAVSPEKRTVFLEHINLSRRLLRAGEGLSPAPAASQGVWAQIAALEPALNVANTTTTAVPVHVPAKQKSDWKQWSLLLLLLLGFAGAGYMFGARNGAGNTSDQQLFGRGEAHGNTTAGSQPQTAAPSLASTEVSAQSLPQAANSGERQTGTAHTTTTLKQGSEINAGSNRFIREQRITELQAALKSERGRNAALLTEINILRATLAGMEQERAAESSPENNLNHAQSVLPFGSLQSGQARTVRLLSAQEEQRLSQRTPSTQALPADVLPRPTQQPVPPAGPWRLETRQLLRSSLPGVNGLEKGASILSDREAGASLRFTAMERTVRVGAAVGGTTFAQVYHTNTGGALNDTIIEQAPQLLYGRAYIAPSIFEGEKIAGLLELGIGGTELGPLGTAGLNLEYRVADRVTVQAGVSSWLLWTSFRNQLHTSTNVNAHFGISLTP